MPCACSAKPDSQSARQRADERLQRTVDDGSALEQPSRSGRRGLAGRGEEQRVEHLAVLVVLRVRRPSRTASRPESIKPQTFSSIASTISSILSCLIESNAALMSILAK